MGNKGCNGIKMQCVDTSKPVFQFLDVLKEKIPRLGRKPVPIITDREAGIVNAIAKVLPDSPLLICWNHILRDLKFWLGKHGATLKDL